MMLFGNDVLTLNVLTIVAKGSILNVRRGLNNERFWLIKAYEEV